MLAREFDPQRPLVATSAFHAGADVVAAGEVFDWRARGLSELDALALFSAGLLTHPTEPLPGFVPGGEIEMPASNGPATIRVPKQRRTRQSE